MTLFILNFVILDYRFKEYLNNTIDSVGKEKYDFILKHSKEIFFCKDHTDYNYKTYTDNKKILLEYHSRFF